MKPFLPLLIVALIGASSVLTATASPEKSEKPAQAPDAAPKTCVVSGEELGSMGKPYEYVHKEEGKPDRTVLFCCKGCVGKFKKDPAKYLTQLDAAADAKK